MSEALPIRGVFCAQLTAVTGDGRIDAVRTVDQARALLASGCDGVAPLGTTGEANSIATRDRMALLEAMVAGGVPVDRILPGTGVPAVDEAALLTRHALSLGVTTVVLLPPYYYKEPSHAGLVTHYARLVDRVGDDRLRIILYHIPQVAQVPIAVELVAVLRERFPGVFVGVKDSGGDLAHITAYIEAFPGFAVFAGADTLLRPTVARGGAGSITATSNLVAAELAFIFARLSDPERAGDVAEAERVVAAVRAASQRWPQIPAIRAMLAMQAGDAAWRAPLPPFTALAAPERDALAALLAEIAAPAIDIPDAPRSFASLRAGSPQHA